MSKVPEFQPKLLVWWDERGLGFKPNYFINVRSSIEIFRKWKKIYRSQSSRIVGQIPIIKTRLRSIKTPYNYVERFQIVNMNEKSSYYSEFFPELKK